MISHDPEDDPVTSPDPKDDPKQPPATIVITNYNYGRFLRAAIDSALEQTIECQIIVVDDGSNDNSMEVLAGYEAGHPDLEVVAQDNGGQGSAINAGWAKATAPVILFLDGDDVLRSNAAERVVEKLLREPTAARCHFRLDWVDEHGKPIAGSFPEPNRPLPDGDLRGRMASNPDDIPWQPTSGNAFRASILNELLPMPAAPYRISADHYLSNLTALHGPVIAIEEALGDYRVHGDNADHRPGFDLERARQILVRTATTHQLLLDEGRRLGLPMPPTASGFQALSGIGLRLSSFRSDRQQHPFDEDDRSSLVKSGLSAAKSRRDLSWPRRGLAAAWVLALGIAPRALVPRIAGAALTR